MTTVRSRMLVCLTSYVQFEIQSCRFRISSQVQTTLSVIEEERDRFMTKLLNEEKTRNELEGMILMRTVILWHKSIKRCC